MLSASSRSKTPVPTSSKSAAVSSGKQVKSVAVEVDTPKQIQRRLMKVYEHLCAADESLALVSVKRTLRTGIQQNSLQARVNT